ncbi:glycosyltransferase family 2 protein [Streptomyces sp. CoH27]|uniref:glycosyltransferase family 2 protein n=1 Tax=Streptomyces sp. CoH27 TaxID=2875763 RepID=UPI001CD621FF|nr:glycosyltransferase [Streptomyces sp. CoH27]
MPSTLKNILIAVPTTGARALRPLLDDLVQQARVTESSDARRVSILLLDNSAAGSKSALEAADACDVRYRRVAKRGYSQVRNAAIDAAQQYDALVFIDDDERPVPGWLRALITGAENNDADVVVGPVVVRLPEDAPQWLDEGRLIRQVRPQEDGPLEGPAQSGNTLVRMSAVRRAGLRFNPAFDRTGGEDSVFFHEMAQRGARFFYTRAALVFETPDQDRMTLSGVARRAYRGGRTSAVVEAEIRTRPMSRRLIRRAGKLARALFRILSGAVCRRPVDCVLGMQDISFVCGWSVALVTGLPGSAVSRRK